MNTLEVTISASDGYSMAFKVECTEEEQKQLIAVITQEIDLIKGVYREP